VGIISENKSLSTLNMASIDSSENQKMCVELVKGDIQKLNSLYISIRDNKKYWQENENLC
jgi:hypothetical protein